MASPTLRFLKALSDPTRLRLLMLVAAEELNVAELGEILSLPQPTVSRHVAALREAGLLRDRRDGPFVYCTSNMAALPEELQRAWEALNRARDEDAETRRDREGLLRILRRRREASRLFFDAAGEKGAGTRQSGLDDTVPWRSLAGLAPRNRLVVDLGTGSGDLLPYLAPRADRVVAVDFSGAMLRRARGRMSAGDAPHVHFVRGELEALPLADGVADGVVASLVLHHTARPAEAVKEMARILKPGGRLVLVDFLPHQEEWLREEEGDVWLGFAPDGLKKWLERAGFSRPLIEEGPPPAHSGRRDLGGRDRPGADRRLKRLRLLWVEAEKRPGKSSPAATTRKGEIDGQRKVRIQ